MTRVGVITQARMTSTRLPGKVLLRAGGSSMLEHHLRRLGRAGLDVIVATTTNDIDDPIVVAAEELGTQVYRGSEADVLSRFAEAARVHQIDTVVRVTSDCPLIDGELILEGLAQFSGRSGNNVFVSNTLNRTFPRGFDFEVFSADSLFNADQNATAAFDREHVTPYIYEHAAAENRVQVLNAGSDSSNFRLTLDTPDDFRLLERLIAEYGASDLGVSEIVEVMRHTPELARINAHVEQKTRY